MANRLKIKGTSERSFEIGLTNKQVFDANNLTANRTWVLPDSNGTAGYVLSTDGTGNLSWAAGGTGTPAGTNTQIQFNNSGVFGASADLAWNDATKILTANGGIQSVDFVQWDTTATPAGAVARQTWDNGSGMLAYTVKGGNLELRIGEDLASLCFQNTGSTIAKGKVVYLAGAQGQRPRVALADNSSDTTSSKTFGVVAESFPSGDEKFVLTQGIIRNIDTNAYAPGTILWLGTNGDYTSTKPVAPAHLVFIGVVLKQNSSSGEIYIKPQNGYELNEIHDVLITDPVADNSLLQYDSVSDLWKNEAPNDVLNTLLPSQTGNNGRYLTTNGSTTSWAIVSSGGQDLVSYSTCGGL